MNKAWLFFKNYLAVVVPLAAFAAVLGWFHGTEEVGPREYRMLTNAWPHLKEQRTRDMIRADMADGKIQQWDYSKLSNAALNDAGLLTMDGSSEDVSVEREKLRQAIDGTVTH